MGGERRQRGPLSTPPPPEGPTPGRGLAFLPALAELSAARTGVAVRPRARPPSPRAAAAGAGTCGRSGRSRPAPRADVPAPAGRVGRTGAWRRAAGGSEAAAGSWRQREGGGPRGAPGPALCALRAASRAPRRAPPADPHGRRGWSADTAPGTDPALLCHATCPSLPGVSMATTKILRGARRRPARTGARRWARRALPLLTRLLVSP